MKLTRTLTLLIPALFLLPGCQPAPTDTTALNERIAVLESKVEELEKQGDSGDLKDITARLDALENSKPESPKIAETPDSSTEEEPKQAAATPASSSAASLVSTVDFSSFPSPERLKELVSFGFLPKAGVDSEEALESVVTRGQYVAMLVEMNNHMFDADSGKRIRTARDGDVTFSDVPTDHPYYKYVQGMVDAGYVIGFDETTFRPDKPLTREEMVAIAAKRDYDFSSGNSDYYWDKKVSWTDKEEVAPKYRNAVGRDANAGPRANAKQAFGDSKLFKPKQEVKAYEAILSLYKVGNHGDYIYDKRVKEASAQ